MLLENCENLQEIILLYQMKRETAGTILTNLTSEDQILQEQDTTIIIVIVLTYFLEIRSSTCYSDLVLVLIVA